MHAFATRAGLIGAVLAPPVALAADPSWLD
jgi:hypothetical protein